MDIEYFQTTIIPAVGSVATLLITIISMYKTKLGKTANQKLSGNEGISENSANELISELNHKYKRQRSSQKIMFFFIIVTIIGVYFLMNRQSVNEMLGTYVSSYISTDRDTKVFDVEFDNSCSREYICIVNQKQTFEKIENYLFQESAKHGMIPVLMLNGFATKNAALDYNIEVSMRRATIVQQRLAEKFIIGGMNVMKNLDPKENTDLTSVRILVTWFKNTTTDQLKEFLSQSANSESIEPTTEMAASATAQPVSQDVSDEAMEVQASGNGQSQMESNQPLNTSASLAIMDLYTCAQRAGPGVEDVKISRFNSGDKIIARFKVKPDQPSQTVQLIWKNSSGQSVSEKAMQIDNQPYPYRYHHFKYANANLSGDCSVELVDSQGRLIDRTYFTVR